jgi:hypothetical protein
MNRVVCAAKLESSHPLKALGLEQHMSAEQLIEHPRRDQRGSVRDAGEPPRGTLDIGK